MSDPLTDVYDSIDVSMDQRINQRVTNIIDDEIAR
jgi:hypothetical protein